jgi:serine/threonine-protein kinase RsbW
VNEHPIYTKTWKIGSEYGQEKKVIAGIAAAFAELGISPARLDDIATAVSEACLNGLEHGNRLDARRQVSVRMNVFSAKTVFRISDEGPGFDYRHWESSRTARMPKEKLQAENPRGWGLYLIGRLADAVRFGNEAGVFFTELEFANRLPEREDR